MDENISRGYIQLGRGPRAEHYRSGRDQQRHHPQPPDDKCSCIYLALVLAGVGFLLPYNSFIIAVDYYQHRYPGTTIIFDMSLVYILMAFVAVVINNVLVEALSLNVRITFGYIISCATLLFVAVAIIWYNVFDEETSYNVNLIAVAVVALGCTGIELEPEFLKCLENNELDILKIMSDYQNCQLDVSPISFIRFNPEKSKKEFPEFCSKYESDECKTQLQDKMEPCLTPERRKVFDNMNAFDLEYKKYICKDNGNQLVDFLSDGKYFQFINKYIIENAERCNVTVEWWTETQFLAIFEEDNCKKIINAFKCVVDGLRQVCEECDFVEYSIKTLKAAFMATSCKAYITETN